ncbi:MAG: hypothetical protein ACXV8O_01390 [Methylobacter sp.]
MRLFQLWIWLLLPPKFYGGGGGSQTPQTNPEEQALAQISQEKWDAYKAKYIPIENQWIAQSKTLDDPSHHNEASSLASNEVKAQYGSQTPNSAKAMTGGNKIGLSDYLPEANDISQSRNKASLGVTDRYLKGQEGVIAMGQGQSASAIQGLSDVADTSVSGQIGNSRNKFNSDQGNLTAYGMAAGGAMAAASNYSGNKAKTGA